jgi:hypothetical protein
LAALVPPAALVAGAGSASAQLSVAIDDDTVWRLLGVVTVFAPNGENNSSTYVVVQVMNAARTGFVLTDNGRPVVFQVILGPASILANAGVTQATLPAGSVMTIDLHPTLATIENDPRRTGIGAGDEAGTDFSLCPAGRPAVFPPVGAPCHSVAGGIRFFGPAPARTVTLSDGRSFVSAPPDLTAAYRNEWAAMIEGEAE